MKLPQNYKFIQHSRAQHAAQFTDLGKAALLFLSFGRPHGYPQENIKHLTEKLAEFIVQDKPLISVEK